MPDILPTFNDGINADLTLTARNLNLGVDYVSADADIEETVIEKDVTDVDGNVIGGSTKTSIRSGSLNCQYDLETDEKDGDPKNVRAAHVWLFRGRYYRGGAVKSKLKRAEAITFSVGVKELQNPLPNLLSAAGQVATDTKASGSAYAKNVTALNVRTGATLSWALEDAPSGMVISGTTTGAISWPTPVAGTYTVKVKCTDTLAGERTRVGASYLKLTVT
jgi:hypothetical protein